MVIAKRVTITTRLLIACCVTFVAIGPDASTGQNRPSSAPRNGLYDANPNHLWNRIHERFHVRTAPDGTQYGFDRVDPLLWRETHHLLRGTSAAGAVLVLDEFLASGGERMIRDPLKRAVFHHDLWAVFDWLASVSEGDKAARSALMRRLARVMRRVAMPRKSIEALPDTYAAAGASGDFVNRTATSDLPRDLFSANGPWVSVGDFEPLLPQHSAELGRSAFIVLWNLPGDAAQTQAYLQKLWNFPQPFVADDMFQFERDGEVRATLNPALPAIPDGTRLALVRKMLLIDDSGVIVPSNVIESIQLRAFPGVVFSELKMSRAALFAGKAGGLRAVRADEGDFITFSAHGMDPFEQASGPQPFMLAHELEGCISCHHVKLEPAITTVLSLRRMLRPASLVDSRHERWARYYTQPTLAADMKSRSYTWGVLQGLWQSEPR
jgi:hypothetical protein